MPPSVAVVIPSRNEAGNLETLLPQIKGVVGAFDLDVTIHVVDGHSTDGSRDVASRHGVNVIEQRGRGYGDAIRTALQDIPSDWIVTLDADCSHPPATLKSLMASIGHAEIVIASRYVEQGYARMPVLRKVLSIVLNRTLRTVFSLSIRDMSSGYRAYHRESIAAIPIEMDSFAFLPEVLVKAHTRGYRILEIPFHYRYRTEGRSKARVLPFGLQYLRLMMKLWPYRNSIASADYDTRAFYGRIPLQRWWQRRRYQILTEMVGDSLSILDVGCGSGQILNALPQIVGMDPQVNKLLFMRAPGRLLLRGSIFEIPFADHSFETVISSQVIEHLPKSEAVFDELVRCLAPGGTLVLGTVDYGGWQWPLIERIYGFVHRGGYADEHITHYTRQTLIDEIARRGLEIEDVQYIAGAEIVVKARKGGTRSRPAGMVTPREFDQMLACPKDRSRLDKGEEAYSCPACRRRYPIVKSIPDFLVSGDGGAE
jgi:glycosyltransferase involved in cell wall biosynthesis